MNVAQINLWGSVCLLFVLILFHFHLLVAAGGTNDAEATRSNSRLGHKVSPLPLSTFLVGRGRGGGVVTKHWGLIMGGRF